MHPGKNSDCCRRASDRRERPVFVLSDRRTGFERRGKPNAFVSTLHLLRDDPTYLLALLLCVNLLNITDLLLTLQWLSLGVAREGNPVIAMLLHIDPVAAGVFKVAVVALGSLIIWRQRSYRRFLEATLGITLVYSAVVAYHAIGSALILS